MKPIVDKNVVACAYELRTGHRGAASPAETGEFKCQSNLQSFEQQGDATTRQVAGIVCGDHHLEPEEGCLDVRPSSNSDE